MKEGGGGGVGSEPTATLQGCFIARRVKASVCISGETVVP